MEDTTPTPPPNETPASTPPPAAPPPAASAAPTAAADIPKDAKTFAMLCHLSALVGLIIPLGNIIGPLVFWLIKKNEFPFVDDQGKEALNFQITIALAAIVCLFLTVILIGLPLLFVVGIFGLVFSIIAAIKANDGVAYRYPFALRLIK